MEEKLLGSLVSYFGAGGVLLVFVAAAAKGLLAWRAERNAQAPTEVLTQQLSTFQAIAQEANKRADAFAAERNELLVKVSRIETEFEHLKGIVDAHERLKETLEKKDAEIRQMVVSHSDATRQMLEIIKAKDETVLAQAQRITVLEEAVKVLKDGSRCQMPNCPHRITT